MSLSFVSSAVLSSTDGVSHNEEISVESKEVNQLRLKNSNAHRPLFEQLRSNREADQEKYDETTKAMRMGMRPLDEEDCAHLDTVESMRNEREQKVRREMEEEIALYRAAKAEMNFDKKEQQNDVKEEEEEEEDDDTKKIESNDLKSNHSILKPSTTIAPVVPIIVGKRKRRTQTSKSSTNNKKINKHSRSSADKKQETNDTATNTSTAITELKAKKPTPAKKENAQYNQSDDDDDDDEVNGSLGGLLGGYGSDSD